MRTPAICVALFLPLALQGAEYAWEQAQRTQRAFDAQKAVRDYTSDYIRRETSGRNTPSTTWAMHRVSLRGSCCCPCKEATMTSAATGQREINNRPDPLLDARTLLEATPLLEARGLPQSPSSRNDRPSETQVGATALLSSFARLTLAQS